MTFSIRAVAMAAAGWLVAAMPLAAQTIAPAETYRYYGETRGWGVYAIDEGGAPAGVCRAVQGSPAGPMLIEAGVNGWLLIVPTSRDDVYGGAIVGYGKADIDAQFGFRHGYAFRDLGPQELDLLRQSNMLTVEIGGDPVRYWPLNGSAAAILKVQECAQTGGAGTGGGANTGNVAPPPQAAPKPVAPKPARNVADCDMRGVGTFACKLVSQPPDPGYTSSWQLVPVQAGYPAFFLRVKADDTRDVWVRFDAGTWQYLGLWWESEPGGSCFEPQPNQGPEAQANLGQDQWGLCVRLRLSF